jgi:hypothetical protein
MNSLSERFAAQVIFFSIFLVTILSLDLYLELPLSRYTLPIVYLLYLLGIFYLKRRAGDKITSRSLIIPVVIPLLFFFGTSLLAHTYDFTFDGENYHQAAVISLADGWNPIYELQPTINAPVGLFGISEEFSKPDLIGYPKVLWLIQSSIYKLTGHINSGVITNIIVALVAFVFLFNLLLRIKLTKPWAFFISLLGILGPSFIQQFFAFTADGFSYQIALIAAISLISLATTDNKPRSFAIFICSWILLVGTKYSNDYIAIILAIVCLGIIARIYFKTPILFKQLLRVGILGFILSIFILSNPFLLNLLRYGSPIYPDNLPPNGGNVAVENIPHNLTNAGKLELLFYGIYSQTQEPSVADSPTNIAQLKIPFTFQMEEISYDAEVEPSERVASGGLLFSGIFTLGLVILLSLFLFGSSAAEEFIIGITGLIIILILIAALALPTPNVLRYTPLITFIPVLALITIVLIDKTRPFSWLRISKFLLASLIAVNIGIYLCVFVSSTLTESLELNQQLASMRNSGLTYNVYAPGFYSSYTRLREAGVKFVETNNLDCMDPQSIDYTYGEYATLYCAQKPQ